MNPVKAGIVENQYKYKFSSYNDYLSQSGIFNSQILKLVFNSNPQYIEIFNFIKYESLNLENENIDIKVIFDRYKKQNSIQNNLLKVMCLS